MSLIDISFFAGEDLNIPNTDQAGVVQDLNGFIQKYEPEFLRRLLGYPLFKAFVAGISVAPPATPDQRFLDILYGKEYTNLQGYLTQWRGLIMTDNPVLTMAGQAVYKPPIFLKAGVTPGFNVGVNTFTFDGTGALPDLRGWEPIVYRAAPLEPDVDYSWDKETGVFALILAGDKTGPQEKFVFQFQLRTDPIDSTDVQPAQSPIANFIYYWFRRKNATQSVGIGEVLVSAENSTNQNPNEKMARAWNEMTEWIYDFIEFMDTNSSLSPDVYPEWKWIFRWDTLRYFEPLNTIF